MFNKKAPTINFETKISDQQFQTIKSVDKWFARNHINDDLRKSGRNMKMELT